MAGRLGMWAVLLLFAVIVAGGSACDDDDDDDSGGSGNASCAESCAIIYETCGEAIDTGDGVLSQDECIGYCEAYGGVDDCQQACLDAWELDGDCDALMDCGYDCV